MYREFTYCCYLPTVCIKLFTYMEETRCELFHPSGYSKIPINVIDVDISINASGIDRVLESPDG